MLLLNSLIKKNIGHYKGASLDAMLEKKCMTFFYLAAMQGQQHQQTRLCNKEPIKKRLSLEHARWLSTLEAPTKEKKRNPSEVHTMLDNIEESNTMLRELNQKSQQKPTKKELKKRGRPILIENGKLKYCKEN